MRTISSHATPALLTLSVLAAGCGIESSIVGGECRAGMVLSGGSCVVPEGVTLITPTDPPNTAGFANTGPKTPPNRGLSDALVLVDGPPVAPTSPITLDPTDPVPSLVDPPAIPLECAAPLIECKGACISVAKDSVNCGACGKICPSNICVDGECQGATPGDVVLIGHDYSYANTGSSQTKVLINALTIPTTDPIRVLSFEDGAPLLAVTVTKALAKNGITNRKIKFTRAPSASSLESATLGKVYDVVIIHDASAVDAALTGASWASSLGGFAAKGGVIIALDRGSSPMPELLSSANLLAVGSHTTLAEGSHLVVSSAADVVGAQVLSPYAAFGAPVSFQGLPAASVDLSWVVRHKTSDGSLGDAVVVHRIVR